MEKAFFCPHCKVIEENSLFEQDIEGKVHCQDCQMPMREITFIILRENQISREANQTESKIGMQFHEVNATAQ